MFLALSLLRARAWLGPGAARLAAATGVLASLRVHALGLAAACGMAILLIAALVAHRMARDSIAPTAPALAALSITAAYLAVALTR